MNLGSWNFKVRPQGLWRQVLGAPVYLYRWRLGFLLGGRFMLIDHVGRRSGATHQTPVELVEHAGGEYIVCSGTGPRADWYQNLRAAPAAAVQVGNRRWTPSQRMLDPTEAAACFQRYEAAHPKAASRLLSLMGNSYDGTDEGRAAMMADMPMVAFSDTER